MEETFVAGWCKGEGIVAAPEDIDGPGSCSNATSVVFGGN